MVTLKGFSNLQFLSISDCTSLSQGSQPAYDVNNNWGRIGRVDILFKHVSSLATDLGYLGKFKITVNNAIPGVKLVKAETSVDYIVPAPDNVYQSMNDATFVTADAGTSIMCDISKQGSANLNYNLNANFSYVRVRLYFSVYYPNFPTPHIPVEFLFESLPSTPILTLPAAMKRNVTSWSPTAIYHTTGGGGQGDFVWGAAPTPAPQYTYGDIAATTAGAVKKFNMMMLILDDYNRWLMRGATYTFSIKYFGNCSANGYAKIHFAMINNPNLSAANAIQHIESVNVSTTSSATAKTVTFTYTVPENYAGSYLMPAVGVETFSGFSGATASVCIGQSADVVTISNLTYPQQQLKFSGTNSTVVVSPGRPYWDQCDSTYCCVEGKVYLSGPTQVFEGDTATYTLKFKSDMPAVPNMKPKPSFNGFSVHMDHGLAYTSFGVPSTDVTYRQSLMPAGQEDNTTVSCNDPIDIDALATFTCTFYNNQVSTDSSIPMTPWLHARKFYEGTTTYVTSSSHSYLPFSVLVKKRKPVITAVNGSTTTGAMIVAGENITLTGQNFNYNTTSVVKFGTLTATIVSSSPTQIVCTIPAITGPGNITVTNGSFVSNTWAYNRGVRVTKNVSTYYSTVTSRYQYGSAVPQVWGGRPNEQGWIMLYDFSSSSYVVSPGINHLFRHVFTPGSGNSVKGKVVATQSGMTTLTSQTTSFNTSQFSIFQEFVVNNNTTITITDTKYTPPPTNPPGGDPPIPGCLLTGSKIMVGENVSSNVEDVYVGDQLWTAHETTKELSFFTVTSKEVMPVDSWYHIVTVDDREIKCSATHLVMVNDVKKVVSTLTLADKLMFLDGTNFVEVAIKSIDIVNEAAEVYKFEVDEAHTYMTDNMLWHHNQKQPANPNCGCCQGSPPVGQQCSCCYGYGGGPIIYEY